MPPDAEPDEGEFDLTPEEEDDLEARHNASIEAQRRGELIPWEALFPPKLSTG